MSLRTDDDMSWLLSLRSIRTHDRDLLAVLGLVVAINVVYYAPGLGTLSLVGVKLQTVLALPMVLFAPGYVLVATLFPREASPSSRAVDGTTDQWAPNLSGGSIDTVERLALSFGMSVAIVPMLVVGLGAAWSFSTGSILATLSVFLVLGSGLAFVRRQRVPETRRFGVSDVELPVGAVTGDSDATDLDRLLSVGLVVSIVVAVAAMGYAVALPYQGDDSAMLYLATENETGQLTTAEYPTTFTVGEASPLFVGIAHRGGDQQYTLVLALERVSETDSGLVVTEQTTLDSFQVTFDGGENWTNPHEVAPTFAGEDLRLHYYLYRGERSPDRPTEASAYRHAYVWIDVENPESESPTPS